MRKLTAGLQHALERWPYRPIPGEPGQEVVAPDRKRSEDWHTLAFLGTAGVLALGWVVLLTWVLGKTLGWFGLLAWLFWRLRRSGDL